MKTLSLVQKSLQLDIPGTICMVGSLICLLMALQFGGVTYPWTNGRVIALFVVFGVLAIAFLATQTTTIVGKSRTIPSSLARSRDVWLAGSYAVCINGGTYVAVLFLPIWFQDVRGRSPLTSGEMLTPLIAGYVVASILAGGITSGFKYYNPAMIIGTLLSVAGSALLTAVNLNSSTARIVGYQLVFGFGIGFGFGQSSYIVQTVLPAVDVPMGVTFITLVQNLSAAVFVAVAQSIFQGEIHTRLEPLRPPSSNSSSLLLSALPKIISSIPTDNQAVAKAAISDSIIRTFYVCLALSCVSIVGALAVKWIPMQNPLTGSSEDVSQTQTTPIPDEKSDETATKTPGDQTSISNQYEEKSVGN